MLTVKSNDVSPEPLAPVNEATPFELAALAVLFSKGNDTATY